METLVNERMRQRTRWAVMRIFLWLLVAGAVAVIVFGAMRPETAKWAGATPPEQSVAPETPMDWLSLPFYVLALVLAVAMLIARWRKPDRRPLWVLTAFVVFWLLWRELPWDERILGDANTWSWAKYLGDEAVPLWAQIVFGGGSIVLTAAVVIYAVVRGRQVVRLLVEKLRSFSGWLFAGGLVLLGMAQAMDKYATVDRHLGTDLAAWKEAGWLGYAEESLEALGPAALAMAVIMSMLEARSVDARQAEEKGGE